MIESETHLRPEASESALKIDVREPRQRHTGPEIAQVVRCPVDRAVEQHDRVHVPENSLLRERLSKIVYDQWNEEA